MLTSFLLLLLTGLAVMATAGSFIADHPCLGVFGITVSCVLSSAALVSLAVMISP